VPAGYPVTAYAMCNALGARTRDAIAALSEGRSGLEPPPFELPFETVAGAVPGELPALPAAVSGWDARVTRIALIALAELSEPVSRAIRRWGKDRVAVVLGTSTGGLESTERAYAAHHQSGRLPAWYDYDLQHPFHAFADLVAHVTGAGGPTYVVSTACSTSTKVLGSAMRLIGAGVADAVLVGGVDSLTQTTLRGFHCLSVLAPKRCKPFSRDREGMNIGEGAALLLVEREGEGSVRVLGVGETSDAHHMSSPDPAGAGARAAMEQALAQAGLDAAAVDYVNAHGTGTKRNDAAEAQAIASVFGARVPVVSTKAFTGHQLGAAGATEAVFSIVAIEQSWIPTSLGADPVEPDLGIAIQLARTERKCRVVVSNSFGFGGSNASVVLGAA